MPFQINTSKWAPTEQLRARVMSALQREAQYRNAEQQASESVRREVGTTAAMQDYRQVAGNPDASREQVYASTQRAFGRILGLDTKAAAAFATNAGLYPKFFPTDTNVTEIEAFMGDAKRRGVPDEIALQSWDDRVTTRAGVAKQANNVYGGKWRRVELPNGGYEFLNDSGQMWDFRTKKIVDAPPELKLMAPQSYSASGREAEDKIKTNMIATKNDVEVFIREFGGYEPIKKAALLWQEAVKGDVGLQEQMAKDMQTMDPDEWKKKYEKTIVTVLPQFGGTDSTAMMKAKQALEIGSKWQQKMAAYQTAIDVGRNSGYYIDEIGDVKPITAGAKMGLTQIEKHFMNDFRDWTKASEDDLMKYGNPQFPTYLVEKARQEWVRRVEAEKKRLKDKAEKQASQK